MENIQARRVQTESKLIQSIEYSYLGTPIAYSCQSDDNFIVVQYTSSRGKFPEIDKIFDRRHSETII